VKLLLHHHLEQATPRKSQNYSNVRGHLKPYKCIDILLRFGWAFRLNFYFYFKFVSAAFSVNVVVNFVFFFPSSSIHISDVLFRDEHGKDKRLRAEKARLRDLYTQLGIKRVVTAGGSDQWFGCSRTTARCFGTIQVAEHITARQRGAG
jgi:hypothetical protein